MFIYVTYDNSTKAVLAYQIVASKKEAGASASDGYRVNVEINDLVPAAFYEEPDNYKVTINSGDSTLATLSIINSANSGIKRKLGGSGLPNSAPYKNITSEIAGDVVSGTNATNRAAAIVALPWAIERTNTISSFGVL